MTAARVPAERATRVSRMSARSRSTAFRRSRAATLAVKRCSVAFFSAIWASSDARVA
ncbi:hypothetical protein MPOCJGCO_3457 [Methylobacterium trifolii]|uniref:Uncharacterized protein n=1 Tax=Methylobacterium trifolii TaxID=1003092 RepID=A0ABQ4U5E4_9HYPH|nr:hypothetical protein MPOCJGCO_3457 [Methylobacterium trifolii]